jgi:hypothetical protein
MPQLLQLFLVRTTSFLHQTHQMETVSFTLLPESQLFNLHTKFHMKLVGMFGIYLHTKFPAQRYNGQIVTAVKITSK